MQSEYEIKNKASKVFNLEMTEFGFSIFAKNISNQIKPQVYIHVSVDEKFPNQVLRIGKAKNGIMERWINGNFGHKNTFLWSIGKLDKYKRYASQYPNYLIFFAGLLGIKTELHVFDCNTEESMRKQKKELIEEYSPIWENYAFKKNIKFQQKYKTYLDDISKYGGALEIITTQRNNRDNNFPDVLTFESKK